MRVRRARIHPKKNNNSRRLCRAVLVVVPVPPVRPPVLIIIIWPHALKPRRRRRSGPLTLYRVQPTCWCTSRAGRVRIRHGGVSVACGQAMRMGGGYVEGVCFMWWEMVGKSHHSQPSLPEARECATTTIRVSVVLCVCVRVSPGSAADSA